MRVIETGTIGVTPGFKWCDILLEDEIPSSNDIDGDNDGEMMPTHGFVIDLSEIASRKLGKQCSMMQEYKIRSMRIGIRHENDLDDNDDADAFAGYIYLIPPTDHVKNALSLARDLERELESGHVDSDSFLLSTEHDYNGFRYSWNEDHLLTYKTVCALSNFDYNYQDITSVYSAMQGLPEQANALWTARCGGKMVTPWAVNCSSGYDPALTLTEIAKEPFMPVFGDDVLNLHYTTLPLIGGRVVWSDIKADNLANDDDYTLHVTVDFELGGAF